MTQSKVIVFASDNYAGTSDDVIEKITNTLKQSHYPYAEDEFCEQARNEFRTYFGEKVRTYFIGTGTASNVIALASLLKSYEGVICSDVAHLNTSECGAFENYTGSKLYVIPSTKGKISLKDFEDCLKSFVLVRQSKPKILSITQTSELGTVYSCEELKELCQLAHDYHCFVHMDGARLANAAVFLNKSLKEITVDVGVDVLSFGSTKNGLICAEAIMLINPDIAPDFPWIYKQSMQLASKMAFIGAQFVGFLTQDLWKQNAKNANKMALLLAKNIQILTSYSIIYPVESNLIFLEIPRQQRDLLLQKYHLYTIAENGDNCTIRIVSSFNITEKDVMDLAQELSSLKKRASAQ